MRCNSFAAACLRTLFFLPGLSLSPAYLGPRWAVPAVRYPPGEVLPCLLMPLACILMGRCSPRGCGQRRNFAMLNTQSWPVCYLQMAEKPDRLCHAGLGVVPGSRSAVVLHAVTLSAKVRHLCHFICKQSNIPFDRLTHGHMASTANCRLESEGVN